MSVMHELIRPALDFGPAFIPHCVREKEAGQKSQAGPQNSCLTLLWPLSHAHDLFFHCGKTKATFKKSFNDFKLENHKVPLCLGYSQTTQFVDICDIQILGTYQGSKKTFIIFEASINFLCRYKIRFSVL